MKDFCIINLPSPFLEYPKAMPPLGVLYVAAAAERAGLDVVVTDLAFGMNTETLPEARVYGISATTPQSIHVSEAVEWCKAVSPFAPVILGGPHATAEKSDALDLGVDYVFVGEAEEKVGEVVSGLIFGGGDGGVIEGVEGDINNIPRPAWHQVKMRHYGQNLSGYWTCTVHGARGCPYKCAFCSKEVFGRKYRRREIADILDEVETLHNRFDYRAIHFLDDALIMNTKDLIELCFGMRELGMKWKCLMRTDMVDETKLGLMAECGCLEIAYGVESGAQEILNRIHKGTTVEQNTAAIRMTEKAGIRSKAFLVVGLPGESTGTVMKTKAWFEEARPSNYTLTALRPFRGSPLYETPEKYGLKIVDWNEGHYSYRGRGELVAIADTEHMKAADISIIGNKLDTYFRSIIPKKVAVV